tara:strand:+ start:2184 stop:2435 length:252 start_codon:yes stop_codon:yes gene_type:complete
MAWEQNAINFSGCHHMSLDGKGRKFSKIHKKTRFRGVSWMFSDYPEQTFGAQKRTRTSTTLRPPAPEAGASTNSAIWAINASA